MAVKAFQRVGKDEEAVVLGKKNTKCTYKAILGFRAYHHIRRVSF